MQGLFCLGKLPYIPMNAQAPVCGLKKPSSNSPMNEQEKIKGINPLTVAIFRFINANDIFLEITLWFRQIDALKNFNYSSIQVCK